MVFYCKLIKVKLKFHKPIDCKIVYYHAFLRQNESLNYVVEHIGHDIIERSVDTQGIKLTNKDRQRSNCGNLSIINGIKPKSFYSKSARLHNMSNK